MQTWLIKLLYNKRLLQNNNKIWETIGLSDWAKYLQTFHVMTHKCQMSRQLHSRQLLTVWQMLHWSGMSGELGSLSSVLLRICETWVKTLSRSETQNWIPVQQIFRKLRQHTNECTLHHTLFCSQTGYISFSYIHKHIYQLMELELEFHCYLLLQI